MRGFTFGMVAAALWLAVAVGVWWMARHSPGHPFRTIRGFRLAGRSLLETDSEAIELPIGPPEVIDLPEVETSEEVIDLSDSRFIDLTDLFPPDAIESSALDTAAREAVSRGPRKKGGITYVLVDDQGRPEMD